MHHHTHPCTTTPHHSTPHHPTPHLTTPPPPAEEGDYHLLYSDKGSRVCLVASEPVTSAAHDWCEVPANTALVVCREKGGILNILLSPITHTGDHPRHGEVVRCLEAVNHTAAYGSSAPHHHALLTRPRSQPSLPRHDSQPALDGPTDSGDSGQAVPASPMPGCHHHHHAFGGGAGARAAANGPVTSAGEDDRLTGHTSSVMSLTCANGLLFSGSTDSTIRVRRPLQPARQAGRQPGQPVSCRRVPPREPLSGPAPAAGPVS